MTSRTGSSVIPALVPPGPPSAGPGAPGRAAVALNRPPLPLATLAATRSRLAVYGVATLDTRGRVADQVAMRALEWVPGLRLDIKEHRGLIVVSAQQQGVFSVTREGHVRLPAVVRQWCGLAPGDRVFIVAEPDEGRLVVHPPAKIDDMVTRAHETVFGGGDE